MTTIDQAQTKQQGSQHVLGRQLRLRLLVVGLRLRGAAATRQLGE